VEAGHEVVRRLEQEQDFDAVVVELPEHTGSAVELTERVREVDDDVAMIALVDSVEGETLVAVLEAGADDVAEMPAAPIELGARLRAVLRRTTPPEDETTLRFADLELDRVTRRGRRGEHEFSLTPTEYALLELLLLNPDRVLSRAQIFQEVWGYDIEFSSNSLDVFVAALRRKTEHRGSTRLIQTKRGVGFVLRAD
jgi:two-component system response regulator MprA